MPGRRRRSPRRRARRPSPRRGRRSASSGSRRRPNRWKRRSRCRRRRPTMKLRRAPRSRPEPSARSSARPSISWRPLQPRDVAGVRGNLQPAVQVCASGQRDAHYGAVLPALVVSILRHARFQPGETLRGRRVRHRHRGAPNGADHRACGGGRRGRADETRSGAPGPCGTEGVIDR